MKNRRILVTAVSGDIANGILKILKEAGETELYGCDVNEIAVGMDLVKVFWKSCYAVDNGYINDLLEKCRKYHITHLIPANEREIEVISLHQKLFIDAGIKILIQSPFVLDICLDKYKTMQFLSTNGILVPDTYIQSGDIPWEIRDCYILKARKSNGSKNVTTIHSKQELKAVDFEKYLLQEYIEGEEYTVGIFRQKCMSNTISFRRILRAGYSYQVELVHDSMLDELAEKIADLFQLSGYINVQLKKCKDQYYIFEINPRISGTVRFRHMLGYDDVLWWLDLVDGNTVTAYPDIYDRAVGIRELNEKFLVLEKNNQYGK